jgi:PKD repeat protein
MIPALLLSATALHAQTPCDTTYTTAFGWEANGPTVVFNPIPSLPTDGYVWDFGDGSMGYTQVVSHTYQLPGPFEVCLSAWYWSGTDSCWTSHCELVDPFATGSPCDSLSADFSFTVVGNTVSFAAEQSDPIWGYAWDFGDGNQATGPEWTHTYAGPTIYQACLTVWTFDSLTQELCEVTACQLVDLSGGTMPCDSTFLASFSWGLMGPMVMFQATSTPEASGYIWDLGDGSPAAYGTSVGHVYEPPGPFEVCLSAWYWSGTDSCWTSHCEEVDPFSMSVQDHASSELQWTAWPNPASHQLFIQAQGVLPARSTLHLFSADGRELRQERPVGWPHTMDVQGLAPGLYLLRVEGPEGSATRRVVVE